MNVFCWNCAKEIDDIPRPVPFRFICPHCDSYQHCCINCQNYQVGLPNNCKIPGTEFIADRQNLNFCDDFVLLGKPPVPKASKDDVSRRLFGE